MNHDASTLPIDFATPVPAAPVHNTRGERNSMLTPPLPTRSSRLFDVVLLLCSIVAFVMVSMTSVQVGLLRQQHEELSRATCACVPPACDLSLRRRTRSRALPIGAASFESQSPPLPSPPTAALAKQSNTEVSRMSPVQTAAQPTSFSVSAPPPPVIFGVAPSVAPLPQDDHVVAQDPVQHIGRLARHEARRRGGFRHIHQPVILWESTAAAPTAPPVLHAIETIQAERLTKGGKPLQGPLCVFVPANGHDAAHLTEVAAFMEAWADASTVLYSENTTVLQSAAPIAAHRGVTIVQANHATWNRYHEATTLSSQVLRNRGATPHSIRGRGQLSIPLFHWIAELVKRDDPLVQNCKWFMKCDTDTYLRRGLLEREVLNQLDHRKPYHVGVPLPFNTQPYHHTARDIRFEYNIGGPGYTFSRGLMAAVDTKACLASMALDPVLLIHDDVGTGFCATYYAAGSQLVHIHTAVASSASGVVSRLLSFDVLAKAIDTVPATTTSTTAATAASVAVAAAPSSSCALRFTSAHPVNATLMQALAAVDRRVAGNVNLLTAQGCEAKLMAGTDPVVGSGWNAEVTADADFAAVTLYWKAFWRWEDRDPMLRGPYSADFRKALRLQEQLFAPHN